MSCDPVTPNSRNDYFIGPVRLTSDWTVVCLLFDISIVINMYESGNGEFILF